MATQYTPETVLKDANKILNVWKPGSDVKLKEITPEAFAALVEELDSVVKLIAEREQGITPFRNKRDSLAKKINETNVRVRAGMKSYYGDDSSEYEQSGGTRTSERKKSARKPKVDGPAK